MKLLMHIVLPAFFIAITGCKDAGVETIGRTQPITEDHSGIADPRARWEAYHLSSYVLEQQCVGFGPPDGVCKVYVRNNRIVDVIRESDGISIFAKAAERYRTVDDLFALAASVNPDTVASLVVHYDPRFGLPEYIYLDRNAQIADEEFSYKSQHIEHLLN